jgi:O-acetyl-ADP-ribose deacetylase (regulator of RNase III)
MQFTTGNIFDSQAEALVNTVNTVGVMGKGVALQFKERFPLNFKMYASACKNGEVRVGEMFITSTGSFVNPKWIVNFPTKKHWMHKSSYAYIDTGLDDLVKQIQELQIQSIAIPPLGAGQGGLDWNRVKEMIKKKLSPLSIDITVYEPVNIVRDLSATEKTSLTKPRAMILALIAQYKKMGYDTSLLEIQKLAYFLQRMGQQDLKLNYKQYLYGPYAHNLQHLLHELENGYIISDQSILDSKPMDLVTLLHENAKDITAFVDNHCTEEEKVRLSRLFKLMSGFESPFGLELLSTVDWIIHSEHNDEALNERVIKEKILLWSKRKADIFLLEHVAAAQKRLKAFSSELNYA